MEIRAARVGDLEVIRGIERRAGALFYDVGMPDIAEHPAPPAAVLARFVQAGRSWVVVLRPSEPILRADQPQAGAQRRRQNHHVLAAEAGGAGAGPWATVGDGPGTEPADGLPVAYVLVEVVDGLAHLEQVSVDPRFGRRGLGRRLIDHVGRWARGRGMPAMTLTTFRGVPWNAPYYARLGFVELADDERGPDLARLMAEEARHGLDPVQRIAMRKDIRSHA